MTALHQPAPGSATSEDVPAVDVQPARRSARILEIVLLWIFASLVTAAWHVSKMTLKQYVLHRFTWTTRDILWMAPVGNLLLLVAGPDSRFTPCPVPWPAAPSSRTARIPSA